MSENPTPAELLDVAILHWVRGLVLRARVERLVRQDGWTARRCIWVGETTRVMTLCNESMKGLLGGIDVGTR
jgi:hypothetical protein